MAGVAHMALDEFKTKASDNHKMYGSHEYDEKLKRLIDEYQERFPVELNVSFVEVSPNMEEHAAITYRRPGNKYYIRFSERYLENHSEEEIRRTMLHELVHVYLYQRGYMKHNHGKVFRWVLGRVGGSFTGETIFTDKWENCIEPFLDEDDK